MISLSGVSKLKAFRPLDPIALRVERNGSITVADGAGRAYFGSDAAAGETLIFIVGGALGRHTVKFVEESGNEIAYLNFRVCSETVI